MPASMEDSVMHNLEAIIVDIYERELPSGLQVSEHPKINSIWGALVGDGRRLFIKRTGLQPHEAPDRYAECALEYYDRCMVGRLRGMACERPKRGDWDDDVVTAARAVLHDLLQADRARIGHAAYAAALARGRVQFCGEATTGTQATRNTPVQPHEADRAVPVSEVLKRVRTTDDIAASAERLIPGDGHWREYARHMVAAALTKLLDDGVEPSREAVLATLEQCRLNGVREYQDALRLVRQHLVA